MRRFLTNVVFLWLVIAGVSVLAVYAAVRPRSSGTLVSPELRKQIDELNATKTRDARSIDSLKREASAYQERGTVRIEHASAAKTQSKVHAGLADSLAAEARRIEIGADSLARSALNFRLAYEERTLEAADLKRGLDSALAAHRDDSTAIALLRGTLVILQQRSTKLEETNAGLQAAIARAEKGCRVLWLKCPSRKTVAVVGVTVGAIGGAATYIALSGR
jgi:hypothetical protein